MITTGQWTTKVCWLQHGVDYALGELPEKLTFLKGLSQMCSRLPTKQADLLMTHMQQALAGRGQDPREDDPEWEDYWDFLALAQDRASKGAHPRSALKGMLPSASPLEATDLAVRGVLRGGAGVMQTCPFAASAHCAQLPGAQVLHVLACIVLSHNVAQTIVAHELWPLVRYAFRGMCWVQAALFVALSCNLQGWFTSVCAVTSCHSCFQALVPGVLANQTHAAASYEHTR